MVVIIQWDYYAITKYKHNCTYITKSHTCTLPQCTYLRWLLDHLAGTKGEHAICPQLNVKVSVAQEL